MGILVECNPVYRLLRRARTRRASARPHFMNAVDQEFFSSKGYVPLRGFYPKARLAGLSRQVSAEVARLCANAGAWKALRKLPPFQQVTRLSTLVSLRDLHRTLATAELNGLVAQLVGQRPLATQNAQLLLSPPNQGEWTLHGLNWHVDVKADRQAQMPGVQMFCLIDDVVPHGGATLALAGSHRPRPNTVGRDGDLRELLGAGGDLESALQGRDVEVIEMSGRAGDLFLMDMRVLHTPSVNSSRNLRVMATCRFLLQ